MNPDHIDSKTCASRTICREVNKLIKSGTIPAEYLFDNYKTRKLFWKNRENQKLDTKSTTLKSLHSILQIGVYFTHNGRIAVFKRPEKEKDGTEKITAGCSIIKSWSPTSLDEDDLSVALAKKVYIQAGPMLRWNPRGIAFSDIFDKRNKFAPHYLFPLFHIELESENRLGEKSHLNERKNTEFFVGWFDPRSYNSNSFQGEFFDPLNQDHVSIRFDGAVDRLLLSALASNSITPQEDFTRGFARYFPEATISFKYQNRDFDVGVVDYDDHMEDLLKVIECIRTEKSENEEVTLQDVIMCDPNFYGIGLKGANLLKWIKQFYDRAFN